MSPVSYEEVGGVAWITLNRPEATNALDAEMGAQLAESWRRIDADPQVRAAVLIGAGRAFCAGVDLSEVGPEAQRDLTGFDPPAEGLAKPLIAAVHGYALGAGCKLAMCADILVAAEDTQFGYPETLVGLIGDGGFAHRPLRQLPHREALTMVLTGQRIDATRAFQLGLLTEVVGNDELRTAAGRWAEHVLQLN
jgi:crotonobetainyl-CoA hydratase